MNEQTIEKSPSEGWKEGKAEGAMDTKCGLSEKQREWCETRLSCRHAQVAIFPFSAQAPRVLRFLVQKVTQERSSRSER